MRRREGDVAFGVAFGELLFVEPVDGAAGDELDRHAGFLRKFLGHCFGDEVAPTAAPDADNEFVLRLRGYCKGKSNERD